MNLEPDNISIISNFKETNAETLAWIYDFCNNDQHQEIATQEIRQNVLKFSKVMDIAGSRKYSNAQANLIEYIRKSKGLKATDMNSMNLANIFGSTNDGQSSTILSRIGKLLSFDIGDIQQLFESLVEGLIALKDYISKYYKNVADRVFVILRKIDIIIDSIKRMQLNTPLMVHMHNKLEMSQVNLRAA